MLASELKGLKAQVQTLLEKGAHDDELIAALMVMFMDLLVTMATLLIILFQTAIVGCSWGRFISVYLHPRYLKQSNLKWLRYRGKGPFINSGSSDVCLVYSAVVF